VKCEILNFNESMKVKIAKEWMKNFGGGDMSYS